MKARTLGMVRPWALWKVVAMPDSTPWAKTASVTEPRRGTNTLSSLVEAATGMTDKSG